jgi:hypothetical protein
MTIDDWFTSAAKDATRRKLAALKPLLEGLHAATRDLRDADWNDDAAAPEKPAADLGPGPRA